MWGGEFSVSRQAYGKHPEDIDISFTDISGGGLYITAKQPASESAVHQNFDCIPVSAGVGLAFDASNGLCHALVTRHATSDRTAEVLHGEAETRMIAVTASNVVLVPATGHTGTPAVPVNPVGPQVERTVGLQLGGGSSCLLDNHDSIRTRKYACLFITKDTNVTLILLLSKRHRGLQVRQLLGEKIIDIDETHSRLEAAGLSGVVLAWIMLQTGTDFTPAVLGVTTEHFIKGALLVARNRSGGLLHFPLTPSSHEEDCLHEAIYAAAYLAAKGAPNSVSNNIFTALKADLALQVERAEISEDERRKTIKSVFVCDASVGSNDWITAARHFVLERVKSAARCIPLPRILRSKQGGHGL